MSNRTCHKQVPPSVCCGEKKAGGPIGTNSFGDSGFVALWCVWNAKRAKRKLFWTFWDACVASVVDFGFWILLLLDFRMVAVFCDRWNLCWLEELWLLELWCFRRLEQAQVNRLVVKIQGMSIQCPQHVLKQPAQECRSHLAHRVQQVDNNKQMVNSLWIPVFVRVGVQAL